MKSSYVFLPYVLMLMSCVPLDQQQAIYEADEARRWKNIPLRVNTNTFDRVLSAELNEAATTLVDFRTQDFQSEYSLIGHGSLRAGKLIYRSSNVLHSPIEIHGDFLRFKIGYGGAGDNWDMIDLALVWNGKYYEGNSGLTADLVISFKDVDLQKVYVIDKVQCNLLALKHPEYTQVHINIKGYDQVLTYDY
jgi:hypothetical protein